MEVHNIITNKKSRIILGFTHILIEDKFNLY
jgi:hypothetical protein